MSRASVAPSAASPPAELSPLLVGPLGPVAKAVGHAVTREVAARYKASKRTKAYVAERPGSRRTTAQSAGDELEATVTAITVQVLAESLRSLSSDERMALIHQLTGLEASSAVLGTRDPSADTVLTTAEVAAQLEVSRPYVAMLCDAGKLGRVTKTEGGHRRISAAAVAAYMAERSKDAGGPSPREAGIAAGLYEHDDAHYADAGEGSTKTSDTAAPKTVRFRGNVAK